MTITVGRFRSDNTEGYSDADLATLNRRFEEQSYLPTEALEAMGDMELKSWLDHCAELVLADYDLPTETRIYRGFKIEKIHVTAGYEPRVSVSRPVPFAVYRTYPDEQTAVREIDALLAGHFA